MLNLLPLLDNEFMRKLNSIKHKQLWAKTVLLTWEETPVEEITGYLISGSINVDGDSAARRTCTFAMSLRDRTEFNDFYWTLNSKIKLYIGLKNTVDSSYPDIIWIPQGLFIITSFNKQETLNNITINIQGRDKMYLLDGTIGGLVTAHSVDFGSIDEIDNNTGIVINKKLPLKDIIREAVHEYAREPLQNIIIKDLEKDGLELLEYRGVDPLYLFINQETDKVDNMTFNPETKCYCERAETSGY